MQSPRKIVLVVGADGGLGGEVTRALLRHGWQVRALARKPCAGVDCQHPHLERIEGNALKREDVLDAALGAEAIVHAVNPRNYHNWPGLVLPMLENTIAAAALRRATVVLPGSLYNFAKDAPSLLTEETEQSPSTRKGWIRREMEERLRDASWDRIRALIVRTGDFFGPSGNSSWLSQGLVRAGKPIRWVLNPGPRDIGHSWAYLPDVAETIARLLEQRDEFSPFETIHFKGHFVSNGEFASTVCQAAGIDPRRQLAFPWWAIRSLSRWSELCAEMWELRYLWERSFELNNDKLKLRLGVEPHTPLQVALRTALVGAGCIAASAPLRPRGDTPLRNG